MPQIFFLHCFDDDICGFYVDGQYIEFNENTLLNNDKILETPQMLWMRVAMGVFLARQGAEDDVIALYNILRERKFCLATPTLYYAGTVKPQMMSSYVYALEDDMKNIMTRGISDNAFIAKWGGGIAGSWSHVRSRNSRIAGTRGKAPGVIPFLQLHQHQFPLSLHHPAWKTL